MIRRLSTVLAGGASKGRAGENVLREHLSQLPPGMLVTDFRVGGKVVEFGLLLPDGRRLPIDSKWTALAELEALDAAKDPGQVDACARAVEKAVAGRAREVAQYLDPAVTAPVAVAAVPDAAYEVLRRAHAEAFAKGVVIVPYSSALPIVLFLYSLVQRFGDAADVQSSLAEVGSVLDVLETVVENRFARAGTMITNGADEFRSQLGKARGSIARARRPERRRCPTRSAGPTTTPTPGSSPWFADAVPCWRRGLRGGVVAVGLRAQRSARVRQGDAQMLVAQPNAFLTYRVFAYADGTAIFSWEFALGEFLSRKGIQVGSDETLNQFMYPREDIRGRQDGTWLIGAIERTQAMLADSGSTGRGSDDGAAWSSQGADPADTCSDASNPPRHRAARARGHAWRRHRWPPHRRSGCPPRHQRLRNCPIRSTVPGATRRRSRPRGSGSSPTRSTPPSTSRCTTSTGSRPPRG